MAENEPVLTILAFVVIVFTTVGMLVSLTVSIPYAVRRIRRYPEKGSAHRLFGQLTLFTIAVPTVCLALFFATGVTLLVAEDQAIRSAVSRAMLLSGIIVLSVMVVIIPVWHSYVEAAADKERRQLRRRERR